MPGCQELSEETLASDGSHLLQRRGRWTLGSRKHFHWQSVTCTPKGKWQSSYLKSLRLFINTSGKVWLAGSKLAYIQATYLQSAFLTAWGYEYIFSLNGSLNLSCWWLSPTKRGLFDLNWNGRVSRSDVSCIHPQAARITWPKLFLATWLTCGRKSGLHFGVRVL